LGGCDQHQSGEQSDEKQAPQGRHSRALSEVVIFPDGAEKERNTRSSAQEQQPNANPEKDTSNNTAHRTLLENSFQFSVFSFQFSVGSSKSATEN
jgi:hypothetical protein